MFDQVVARPARRSRLKTVAIVSSAMAHAAVAAVLVVWTMWSVDKVETGPIKEDIVFYNEKPPASAAAQPPGQKLDVPRRKQEKRQVKDTVQPTPAVVTPPAPAIGNGDPSQPPGGGGNGDGKCRKPEDPESDLPLCADSETPCEGDECGEGPPIDAGVPIDAPPEPCNLPTTITRGHRVAGDDQIRPTRETQLEMMRSGKDTVRATFQLCVSPQGAVTSVRRMGPGTGFSAYDEALEQGIWGWRYAPSMFSACSGRAATSICTVATFVYTMKQ